MRREIIGDIEEVVRPRSTKYLRYCEFGLKNMRCLDAHKTAKMATEKVRDMLLRLIIF